MPGQHLRGWVNNKLFHKDRPPAEMYTFKHFSPQTAGLSSHLHHEVNTYHRNVTMVESYIQVKPNLDSEKRK